MPPTYPKATWRLIKNKPAPGAWNMAVDEALLRSMKPGQLPVLRFYAWDPPCVSLGYAQSYGDLDPDALVRFKWDVVRRPTGGRAILHTDELTYSVVAPYDEPRIEGGVLESYHRLSQALLASLHILNLPAEAQQAPVYRATNGPVCFEVPSNYEITLGGKKIIGSAQARKKEGVLQHGTLPLNGDLARITKVLKFSSPSERHSAAEKLLNRATTVGAYLDRMLTWDQAAGAFEFGFQQTLDLELVEEPLREEELDFANQIISEKYGMVTWNQRC
jgi:lipoyl(octanoyl) transferase